MMCWIRWVFALPLLCAATATRAQDFTQHGTQPGLYGSLDGPDECLSCHGTPGAATAFMPSDTWSGSMMSHATRDPLFWAALDVANRDVPGIGDWCLRCHTSQGWYGGRVRKTGIDPPLNLVNGTNGCLLQGDHDDFDSASNDYTGVTCHNCHRMNPTGPAGEVSPIGSGGVWLDDAKECNGYFGACRKGPKHYAATSPLQPPHGWEYSAFITSSAQCGSCHDVSSPIVDGTPLRTQILANGSSTGRAFPAERTFTEWQQSRFGDRFLVDSLEQAGESFAANVQVTDCQDCHMRKSMSPQAQTCTQNPPGSRTGQLAVHEFVGGNSWMLRLIKSLYAGVAQPDRGNAIDRAIVWAEEMLTQRSASITLALDPLAANGDTLNAHVTVTNRAGHKLPTGYGEGRRMWLHVRVRDAMNQLVYESGAWDAGSGELDLSPAPKIYEVLQGVWDAGSSTCKTEDGVGRKLFHFALNNCIAKDNRIPPEGFTPATADDPLGHELRPVGYVYPETTPGSGVLRHFDVTDYAIPVPVDAPRPLAVTATLRYQVASKEYIEFLRDEAVNNAQPSENTMCGRDWDVGPGDKSRGQFMYDLWSDPSHGRSPPVDMVTASAQSTATH